MLSIQYTARTWATDIDSMLTEYTLSLVKSSLTKKENRWKYIIFKNSAMVALASGITFFVFSVIGAFIATNKFMISSTEKATSVLIENTETNLKVDFLLRYIVEGEMPRFYFFLAVFLLIMLVASVLVGAIIYGKADGHSPESFILLTKKSREKRDSALRRDRNKFRDFLLSIMVAIIVNVLSSYLFVYLTTQK
jgi:hypothetical protein